MLRRLMVVLVAAAIVGSGTARADQARCRKALGKAVEKYAKSRLKAVAKCEDQRSSGALAVGTTCREQCTGGTNSGAPCVTGADCDSLVCGTVSDATASGKLATAVTKFNAAVGGKCATPLPVVGPACDGSTGSVAALEGCVTQPHQEADTEQANADSLARTIYDTAAPVDASLVKCQAAISKEAGKYLDKRMKAALKCNEAVAKGKIPGPCPDAAAATTYEALRVKLDAGIRKKCTETQLASDVAPKLDFGFPCEKYKLVTFKRDTPATSGNSVPVLDRFIRCMTDATAAVADRYVSIAYPGEEPNAFAQGVAAGDATDSAAIFWTRLPDSTLGALLDVATDSGFTTGLQTVSVGSDGGDDGTVKEEVTLLTADTTYYYRFRQGSNTSTTGKIKTLPLPSTTATVRVGWTGDANAFFRPYSVLDPMRLQNPDAWFFIGDTIYGDDPRSGTGVAAAVGDYYGKYRENREDGALRNVMASTGTYVMWDDHEVRNDFAGDVAAFAAKMEAGNHAFRRYNPIREDGGDEEQLFRSFKWGTHAAFPQVLLQVDRDRRLPGAREPREPDGRALVPVELFPIGAVHRARVPYDVRRFLLGHGASPLHGLAPHRQGRSCGRARAAADRTPVRR